MRLDYPLYALAVVFFIVTAVSFVLVVEQVQQSLWIVSTVILGLFSIGLGYTQRPKAKMTSAQAPEPSAAELGDSHLKEAHITEDVEKHTEPTITPPSVTSMPSQVITPLPTVAPSPVETISPLKSELTALRGINEKRAAQLKALGINSIDALAKASAEDLAKNLTISPKITRMWIGSAKKLKK